MGWGKSHPVMIDHEAWSGIGTPLAFLLGVFLFKVMHGKMDAMHREFDAAVFS